MHVCLVLENHLAAVMGGAEHQAHLLARELSSRKGTRVTYLARTVPVVAAEAYEIRQFGSTAGFRRRSVLFDSWSLWRSLTEIRPDVIYQRMKQSYTLVCAEYGRRAGIPVVFHAASEPDVDGRWLRRRLSPNVPLDLLDVVAGNIGVRLATHVIVQTSRQGALLRQRFKREPFEVVRNFQTLPGVLPPKSRQGTRVLWVGNIKAVKRPEIFLEVAAHFEQDVNVEFWMVGRPGGNRSLRPTMAAIARCPNVKYFGELPLQEVNSLMSAADIFVNTSSFEGSPNTFIQAWARGAVVTSIAVDVDEGMDSLGIGYCTRGVDRLIGVIEQLSRTPEQRRFVTERAFEYVHRKHSLANAERLANILLEDAGRSKLQTL